MLLVSESDIRNKQACRVWIFTLIEDILLRWTSVGVEVPLLLLFFCWAQVYNLELVETRRERLKSALYLRLKKRKTFFFGKKLEIFEKKISFGKCRTVPKNVKGGPFLIYKHAFCSKITKNSKGGPFGDIKKIRKKNLTAPKKIERGGGGYFSPVRACM